MRNQNKRRSTRQYRQSVTGQRTRTLVLRICAGASIFLLCAAAFSLFRVSRQPYVPPEFDPSAVSGEPSPPDDAAYTSVGAENTFAAEMASNWVRREDGTLPVWFTNPADSGLYLLLRMVRKADGAVVYESGVVRPGEYVAFLAPLLKLSGEAVEMEAKIYSFEPETYYSMGTLSLSGMLS